MKPIYHSLLLVLALGALPLLLTPTRSIAAQETTEPIVAPIAFQPFQHGFMLWRQDNDLITVAYSEVLTKFGTPCQEVYRDTFEGQAYEIPPAPPGQFLPTLGFGWRYANDSQLASRIGYATAEELSRVAEIRLRTTAAGQQVTELSLSEAIPGYPNPLVVAQAGEPGLTYCFPRGNEDRAVLNTWIALQRFQYGFMNWRQDRPDLIEVIHYDTEFAPELSCGETLRDTWKPGEELSYGELAVPGRRLPVRGFGKIWIQQEYLRRSLGYPIEPETGGFAQVSFERFVHPTRGDIPIRLTLVHLPGGEEFARHSYFPGGGDQRRETLLSQDCATILIPHRSR